MKKYSVKKIAALFTRREVLGFIGGTATVSLFGCLRGQSASVTQNDLSAQAQTSTVATPSCVVKPEQTEGPYFVDEKLNRSDIRSDPTDGSVKQGTPLRLIIQVSQLRANTCTPLSNAIVDVWHCDAKGVYSDVNDRSFSTVGTKFLRGYQTTDAKGIAQFVTIYPGWYPGRAVHVHFKIRTNSQEFTSQLYFDEAITDRVHAQAPYAAKGQRNQRNQTDGIFQDGGEQLLLQLTQDKAGYVGKFEIALA
jgi:protocatechuate 3,4-dioxygenase beta subunit